MAFKKNTKYYFRRRNGHDDSPASLVIFEDGSAIIEDPNGIIIYEGSPDAWQSAVQRLENEGWEIDPTKPSEP